MEALVRQLKDVDEKLAELEERAAVLKNNLEVKKAEKCKPFYARRFEIISGKSKPNDSELEGFADGSPEEAGNEGTYTGIPYFWLTVLRNQDTVSEHISKRDEDALQYLEDIRCCKPSDTKALGGFRVEFHFSSNPYFSQKVLWKQICVADNLSPQGMQAADIAGIDPRVHREDTHCTVNWKDGMNLTFRAVDKKKDKDAKKAKKGKKGNPLTSGSDGVKLKPCASFFSLFTPTMEALQNEMDFAEDPTAARLGLTALREKAQARAEKTAAIHFEILGALRQEVIPKAASIFSTGSLHEPVTGGSHEAGYDDDDEFEVVSAAEQSVDTLPLPVRKRLHAVQTLQSRAAAECMTCAADAFRDLCALDTERQQLFDKRTAALSTSPPEK
eukprot:gene6800-8122_t